MWFRRHPWITSLSVLVVTLTCPGLILIGLITHRIGGKSEAWRSSASPAARAGDGQPMLQLESHTCGLLALSAAYALYDLAPDDKNLRYRLGVDVPANPLDSTSTGTLHPDLLRVLVQDGFSCSMPSPGIDDQTPLRVHLQSGDVALLLIQRRETGGLHWVLADAIEQDAIRIVDSLQEQPSNEPIDAFVNDCVLSIILIKPAGPGTTPDLGQAHRDGAAEMIRVKQRLDRLSEPDK